jgi:hypothetical protein
LTKVFSIVNNNESLRHISIVSWLSHASKYFWLALACWIRLGVINLLYYCWLITLPFEVRKLRAHEFLLIIVESFYLILIFLFISPMQYLIATGLTHHEPVWYHFRIKCYANSILQNWLVRWWLPLLINYVQVISQSMWDWARQTNLGVQTQNSKLKPPLLFIGELTG